MNRSFFLQKNIKLEMGTVFHKTQSPPKARRRNFNMEGENVIKIFNDIVPFVRVHFHKKNNIWMI